LDNTRKNHNGKGFKDFKEPSNLSVSNNKRTDKPEQRPKHDKHDGIAFCLDTPQGGVLQESERCLGSKADIQTFDVKPGGRLNRPNAAGRSTERGTFYRSVTTSSFTTPSRPFDNSLTHSVQLNTGCERCLYGCIR
jgi:hypothetical protein